MVAKVSKWKTAAWLVPLILLVIAGGLLVVLHEPRPELPTATVKTGPSAERQADRVAVSVGQTAWDRTGAVRFRFAGHAYLWDRTRGAFEVRYSRWGEQVRVVQYTDRRDGFVFVDSEQVFGKEQRDTLEETWGFFANDSFWLAAPFKTRDGGTQRYVSVGEKGVPDLYVEYGSGGVTPGDLYRWKLDPNGLPNSFELWVSIIPIGGLSVTWEGWHLLPTGARVATEHRLFGLPILVTMEGVEAAESLPQLLGNAPDPFQSLFPSPKDSRHENR